MRCPACPLAAFRRDGECAAAREGRCGQVLATVGTDAYYGLATAIIHGREWPTHPPAANGPGASPRLPLLGDLVAALASRLRLDRLAAHLAAGVGKSDCGCLTRRNRLNALDAAFRRRLACLLRPVRHNSTGG